MKLLTTLKQPSLKSCVLCTVKWSVSVHLERLLKNGFYDKIGCKRKFGVRTEKSWH